jgi:hypothetical protein
MKESKVQTAVLNYLLKKGVFAFRVNNTAIFDDRLGQYRSFAGLKGVPDLIAITPPTKKQCGGIFVGLEIKTTKGKLSTHQVLFRNRCYSHNCEYHVIRSLEDIKALDHLWG